ncbi:hypothetical protein [uncultured Megasphaera sp.]|uniref:hypothetical protein n=1 Tax=uncultured Megasphaera sp. TaxID=165188 RepID=UPI0025F761E9|nr:hypothetical protein [uncultured Megasphaera sp.]
MSRRDDRINDTLAKLYQDDVPEQDSSEKQATFKDQVSCDLDIFINLDEFADDHNLNGDVVKAIVESPTSQEKWLTSRQYNLYDGLEGMLYIVHCRKQDLSMTPVYGQRFDLDGVICIVDSVIDDMGILTIELHAEVT